MTIDEYLICGSAFERKLTDINPDVSMAAEKFNKEELLAKRNALFSVEQRCVISGMQLKFLDRVLSLMP